MTRRPILGEGKEELTLPWAFITSNTIHTHFLPTHQPPLSLDTLTQLKTLPHWCFLESQYLHDESSWLCKFKASANLTMAGCTPTSASDPCAQIANPCFQDIGWDSTTPVKQALPGHLLCAQHLEEPMNELPS